MTDGRPHVFVDHGKGVVANNYGTVFQTFAAAPAPLASCIRTAQFRALVDERNRDFGGRDFIFAEVDRVLNGANGDSGYLLIKGEPGIGKTSIAAALVLRQGLVHHFNIASDNIRSPRQFLENICAQLIVRYGLDYPTLPALAGEDGGFLRQLLDEAAEAAARGDQLPVVVVVDALDEAERNEADPDVNRLYLPRTLPRGVFVVVTGREEDDVRLDVDRVNEIWLRDDDPQNTQDVRDYVHRFVRERHREMSPQIAQWRLSVDDFVAEITRRSEGNFMYLVHVLSDLANGKLAYGSGGANLPVGLRDYYRRHWRQMKDRDEHKFLTRQRPVLCFLAVGREPVTIAQIADWTQLDPSAVQGVVAEWHEFLNVTPGTQPRYRLYHRSFADFLDAEEGLRWYHEQIVEAAMTKIPGFTVR